MKESPTAGDFRALAERSAIGVWHISVDGHTIYAKPAMCALLEIDSPRDLAGTTYHCFLTPESREIVELEHRKLSAGESWQYEIEILGRRGGSRQVLVCGAPLLSADGKLKGYIGSFSDITTRKRAEEALRRSEAKYRTLVETAHDCIWACGCDGIVTFANRAWRRVLGLSENEIMGRPFVDFLLPAEAERGQQVFAPTCWPGKATRITKPAWSPAMVRW